MGITGCLEDMWVTWRVPAVYLFATSKELDACTMWNVFH